jgi:hypothetical protein
MRKLRSWLIHEIDPSSSGPSVTITRASSKTTSGYSPLQTRVACWYICIPKFPILVYLLLNALDWKFFGIFMAIWCNFLYLMYWYNFLYLIYWYNLINFVVIWYTFSSLGMLYQEKPDNPALNTIRKIDIYFSSNCHLHTSTLMT